MKPRNPNRRIPGEWTFETCVCGDELWFTRLIPTSADKQVPCVNETYELIDDVFQKSNRPPLLGSGNERSERHQFFWEGQPAYVSQPGVFLADLSKRSDAIVMATRQNDAWRSIGQLSIPQVAGEWSWEGKPIRLEPALVTFDQNNGRPGVQIHHSGDAFHLFVHSGRNGDDTRLFYHRGLEVVPISKAISEDARVDRAVEADEPASSFVAETTTGENLTSRLGRLGGATAPSNTETSDERLKTKFLTSRHGRLDGATAPLDTGTADERLQTKFLTSWSLVREKPTVQYLGFGQTNGLLIDGKPAALIIDNLVVKNPPGLTGRLYPTAQLYRLEGTAWNEYAAMSLPCGATTFATFTTRDGQRSYFVSRSYLGESYVYALEANGFRDTSGSGSPAETRGDEWKNPVYEEYKTLLKVYGAILATFLLLGVALAACTSVLMRSFTIPDYGFGMQTVRLASLERRGTARLIDLALIGLPTVGLGCWLTRGFDWVSYAEAQTRWIEHSSIQVAMQIMVILLAWFFAICSAMVVAQARWGITPGKWLCRLSEP